MAPANFLFILYVTFRFYRAFIYPFRRPKYSKPWPIDVVLYYLLINTLFSLLQVRTLMFDYWGLEAFYTNFLAFLAIACFLINVQTVWTVCGMRTNKKRGYKVTKTGFFKSVTLPNYGSELVMWLCWALCCSLSLGSLSVIAWLLPIYVARGKVLHAWNKRYFTNYHTNTTPLIPGFTFQPKRGDFDGFFDFMII